MALGNSLSTFVTVAPGVVLGGTETVVEEITGDADTDVVVVVVVDDVADIKLLVLLKLLPFCRFIAVDVVIGLELT